MGEASKHTELATFLEIPVDNEEEPQPAQVRSTTTTHGRSYTIISPIWRLSSKHNGSTLYDSYELRAVTHQLNRAIQGGSKALSYSPPNYMYCFSSPYYRQRLERSCKESVRTPKRISCTPLSCATTELDKKPNTKPANVVTRGFVTRAWKKVKQGFMKNKQRYDKRG